MKVVVTREIPQNGLELLKKQFGEDLTIHPGDPMSDPELKAFVQGADAILCLLTDKITPEVLGSAGSNLKIVANMAVGLDNIDIKSATDKGVVITNTPGVLTEAVGEHALALLMSVARRIVESDKFMRTGKFKHWEPLMFLGPQLSGKTLGIVGLGRIGNYFAKICKTAFDMKIVYYDVQRNDAFENEFSAAYSNLDGVLKVSDFVSIHVPLLPSTHHLISEKELKIMKPTAILINTSRGPVIDEVALVKALKEKWIDGAGLDVFEFEPKLTEGLAELDNVILTPHTASATKEARNEMSRLAAQSIVDVIVNKKTPENIVNKDVQIK